MTEGDFGMMMLELRDAVESLRRAEAVGAKYKLLLEVAPEEKRRDILIAYGDAIGVDVRELLGQ